MYKIFFLILSSLLIFSCSSKNNRTEELQEDKASKQTLQGIWIDENTDSPIMRINGDSIYYADMPECAVNFKVFNDTIYAYGTVTNEYKIEKLNDYNLWFRSITGDILKLYKSENEDDIKIFINDEAIEPTTEVVKKDSVVMFDRTRYRGYVYINPTQIKVTRPSISDEGISLDKIYYDNIIHICVYEGRKKLFSKDISKNMMKNLVPDDFLKNAILADMDFMGVDSRGYHYRANIGIPDDASCYLVNITISKKGDISYKLLK